MNRTRRRIRLAAAVGVSTVAVSFAAGLSAAPAPPPGAGAAPRIVLPWPTKPFRGPHRIQGTLDEPRGLLGFIPGSTPFIEQATAALNQAIPAFNRSAHFGVDISAPDGTPVYAVNSGIAVTQSNGSETNVHIGAFAYWHLQHPVRSGTHVVALRTVIGRVYPGQHHVHFTRLWHGIPVNPLRFGGFRGARDTAPPVLGRLRVIAPSGGSLSAAAIPAGKVALFVRAFDVYSQGGTEVGLYRLSWSLTSPVGTVVFPTVTTMQADTMIPDRMMGLIMSEDSLRVGLTTDFSYRLFNPAAAPLSPLVDFSTVPPGAYVLRVRAEDAAGNATNAIYPIRVITSGATVRP